MTDNKPYIIRAIYEWICDNSQIPYVYVDTQIEGVLLPENLYTENPLILNISSSSCQNLLLANEEISFQARFGGRAFKVCLPVNSIMAIVSKESGRGMTFEITRPPQTEEKDNASNLERQSEFAKKVAKKNKLKVIK